MYSAYVLPYTCSFQWGFRTSPLKSQFPSVGLIKSLVCVEAGHFDAQEMGCVDVPATALSDNPQWFNSPGALQNMAHLLTLQQSAAVSETLYGTQTHASRILG